MHNCYTCGILFDKIIYKAYDKSLCSKICQQKLINNYIYTHECKIVNKKDYYCNLDKTLNKNNYQIYNENKENIKNTNKNLIYYKLKNVLYFMIYIIKIISPL
tara:strand:- start:314 stop:622 length:309 start_codon:yes stop_codon:yes gene_type:complete